ncbi:hypothetical protein AWQ21_14595 (plasmid) [Picosynechococcus sp. PCC 7003]|nr:hypothetical protein AWQ21_14595 [Picosynechococcus sp. PCC 7003]
MAIMVMDIGIELFIAKIVGVLPGLAWVIPVLVNRFKILRTYYSSANLVGPSHLIVLMYFLLWFMGFFTYPPEKVYSRKRLTHLRELEAVSIVEGSLLYQSFRASIELIATIKVHMLPGYRRSSQEGWVCTKLLTLGKARSGCELSKT